MAQRSERSAEEAEEAASRLESAPLLPRQDAGGLQRDPSVDRKSRFEGFSKMVASFKALENGPMVDSMTYRGRYLTTWTIFTLRGVTTALSDPVTWSMAARLLLVSCAVAAAVYSFVEDPENFKSSKFHGISDFLRVFVGLMLSFFMSSALNRWQECAQGFMELFDAIRCLHMQLFALGVRIDVVVRTLRYGVTSAWLVSRTLQMEQNMQHGDKEAEQDELRSLWKGLLVDEEALDTGLGLGQGSAGGQVARPGEGYVRLSSREEAQLRTVRDPACMLWTWVSSLLTRMSQDGDLPPMQSPTYCHIMRLVEAAHGGIRHVRQSMTIQTPFTYVHMVALLVHINSIASALSFGLVLGCFVGTQVNYLRGLKATKQDLLRDLENLVLSFVISIIGAFLYHVLFVTCMHITQPFSYKDSEIPTDRLLMTLQQDLLDATAMARNPPSWEPPCFKPQVKE